ncbi:MAG: hypothetical protein RLZZ436_1341 [Planctomycetota bacterium]
MHVAIVGGGPGGLMTGYLLRKLANRPFRLTLFESSERLGGKVLTPRFSRFAAAYEAGAAEFYDYSPIDEDPLKELVAELGLSITPMGGNSVFLSDRRYATLEDVGGGLGPAVERGWLDFHERSRDRMSAREFYESDNSEFCGEAVTGNSAVERKRFESERSQLGSHSLQAFVETLIHSDLAAEWEQTSVGYGLQNYLMNDPRYMRLYSIAGGNEQLVERLAERTAMEVCLRQRVLSVAGVDSGVMRLRIGCADGEIERDFDTVVLCLPMLALTALEFRGERLRRAMARHMGHHDHPAHYLRVTVLFRRRFWSSWLVDSWCMLDAWGGCCVYDETARQPGSEFGILGWLFGGAAAVELNGMTDEQLIAAAVRTLPRDQDSASELLIEGRVHRWIGAVSAMPGGERPTRLDFRHQPEPVDHAGLFVVGDYLFDSTLNGVLDSAGCVAGWLAAELERR